MAHAGTGTGLQLRSTIRKDGTLELSLVSVATPEPKPEEVVVRVEASPINPSDQGLLFGSAAGSNAAGYSYYESQRRYDQAYVQCMYARGNQVPVRAGYRGPPARMAPPPGYGPYGPPAG